MRLRYPLSILLFLASAIPLFADWRMHPTFDGEVNHVVETPDYVYFTSRVLPSNNMFPDSFSLFRYDKNGEEMMSLSTDNLLSYNTVSSLEYSPERGYLVVVYTNHDIDLIYDNGKVVNIPAYRIASLSYPKTVNSITVSPSDGRIYLATNFGYLTVNDTKHEIAESRIYGTPVKSVAKVGGRILLLDGNRLLSGNAAAPLLSLSDFDESIVFDRPYALYPLGGDKCVVMYYSGGSKCLEVISVSDSGISRGVPVAGTYYNVEYNKNGLVVSGGNKVLQITPDGGMVVENLPQEDWHTRIGSYDFSEIWLGAARKGVKSIRKSSDSSWAVTHDYMIPDSPSPFISPEMISHPELGLLAVNQGFDYNFAELDLTQELLLSGYKDGMWSNYAPAYRNAARTTVVRRPGGIAVDPDNRDYLYVSSVANGFARINLKDPTDILHMSKPSDPGSGQPGFVAIVPDQTGDDDWACRFSAPRFDLSGNLWMSYADLDNQNPSRLHLLCWIPVERKATVSASDFHAPAFVEVEGISPTNVDELLPLSYKTHGNWLLYCNRIYDNQFALIDTGGTPLDNSDDKVVVVNSVYDQDGAAVDLHNVRTLWEDPLSGNVWVGHGSGVFYFNPDDFMKGTNRVTRIKVARNDGTNLADYLLNEVIVNHVTSDGAGRKWFATGGAGLVCLSSDDRTIEEEITAGSGSLPDDIVYCAEYIPESNSLMISTAGGVAEYFLPSSASAGGESAVRAYPNPVRPDYVGYVTIDGLPANALVKIMDASGNLIKELSSEGRGEVGWDVTNLQFKRVSSGVYFVLSSGIDTGSDFSNVAKILVVN